MDEAQVRIILTVIILACIQINMSGTVDWKPLELQFQKVHKLFINLETNEKRLFTEHFNKVYKHVTESMGEIDEFFTKVFKRQQLAGSYADRIKVGQPNEYDALMILDFPDPIVKKSRPGFVKINVRDGIKLKWSTIEEKNYKTLIDKDGYLLQDKVLDWLRNLIYNVVKSCNSVFRIGNNEYSVKHSSNGPAVTLDLTITKCEHGTTGSFSIDFVGALAFDFQKKWFADFTPPFLTSKNWNAIAKPSKTVKNQNQEWTCSYADIEREYLRDTQTLKQLIRIFKKIRDTQSLSNLKSYYIKVIFLHQRKKQNNDYWKNSLGVLFSEMFEILLKTLEQGKLVSFWHKEYNMFGELEKAQITDMFNKLKKIKGNIDKNLVDKQPEYILSVILTEEELKKLEVSSNGNTVSAATTSDDTSKVNENKSCTVSQHLNKKTMGKLKISS
ncbi:hypothetical protein HA402_003765 [Bradysia odoriphaga]|nr:hypothetical protein HA402_003765 [Bradysia odoriphaga]